MEAELGVTINISTGEKAYVGYRSNDQIVPAGLNGNSAVILVTVTSLFS